MSRPPFRLTDDQARALAVGVAAAAASHPLDPASHRPFVRAFLRAVHGATGQTYSPTIYRRLLAAYAPDRSPSTATLALEKEILEQELATTIPDTVSPPGPGADGAAAAPLADILRRVLRECLPSAGPGQHGADREQSAQFELMATRLRDIERERDDARAHAARLAGQLQEAVALRAAAERQVEEAGAALAAQRDSQARLADEMAGFRQFALQAVDGVRGETRAVRERCAYLEAVIKDKEALLETFRQLAYRQGAAIPSPLQGQSPR